MTCSTKKIQIFDVGTELIFKIVDTQGEVVPIADALELQVTFGRPDSTHFTRAGELVSTGADGRMRYTTVGGDLNQAGTWKLQAVVQLPSGKYRSRIILLEVERNIDGASLICPEPLDIVLELPSISAS